ncbi:hypothetical protein [Acinetobacter pollinis]|uniref:hypothetical protein n=1 Tax=Acinetobacter pollinis TaxID=2605270 RepID=UPI0018A2E794|nr:hypothetical protein [Acinetobacter pollinis]MBF7691573.1 hypothetical protein [Acinetobacter pollinis]MBF7699245.1 hypothetical protein [Acinetobacter pollinis]
MEIKNIEINGYKLFLNNDDAIYVAKSKDDVLEYYKELVGDDLGGDFESDEAFKDQLIILQVDSDYVAKLTKIHDDENGCTVETTIYDLYKEQAELNVKCEPIVWFNW